MPAAQSERPGYLAAAATEGWRKDSQRVGWPGAPMRLASKWQRHRIARGDPSPVWIVTAESAYGRPEGAASMAWARATTSSSATSFSAPSGTIRSA